MSDAAGAAAADDVGAPDGLVVRERAAVNHEMQSLIIRNRAPGRNVHDVRPWGLTGIAAAPGDGLVADEGAVLDREETLASGVDGAAVDHAKHFPTATQAVAVLAESLVAEEGAAGERVGCPDTVMIRIPDGAPLDVGVPLRTHGPVGDEGAVEGGEHAPGDVGDSAAVLGSVVGEDVVGEVDGAAPVHEAAPSAPALRVVVDVARTQSVGDRQACDGDGEPLADVEDPERIIAADGQLVGARPLDVQALPDGQLVAGQRDRLTDEAGGEDDGVAVLGAGDGVPQGPETGVVGVQDRQRAEGGPVFEAFEPRQEPAPPRQAPTGGTPLKT